MVVDRVYVEVGFEPTCARDVALPLVSWLSS